MEQIVLKNPNNYIYMGIPLLVLIILILGVRKRHIILTKLRLATIRKYEKLRIFLMVFGIIIICFSVLGPQKLDGTVEVKRESLDIYVLLDTSKSMLAGDIVPNRLERQKQIINTILDKLDGDRIGFIPFSSSAYIQMPLTDDYNMAKMFVDVIDTDMIGGGGSNVGKAITLAYNSFERATVGDKVILIISDGEEHSKESEEVLRNISDKQLKVYAIGVGTIKGGLIPIYDNQSNQIVEYKKDNQGNHIMTKLNDATLKNIASIGNGKYYSTKKNGNEVGEFLSDISSLKKDRSKTKEINQYKQLYVYFLLVGLIIFLVAYLLPVRRQNI
ncbi:MAG: VWA domain-containing protein [Vallitalea sp.]|nr:VWA domain-containing protein [Vallitalea sp.]